MLLTDRLIPSKLDEVVKKRGEHVKPLGRDFDGRVFDKLFRMFLQFLNDRRDQVLKVRIPEVGLFLIRVELVYWVSDA